MRTLIIALLVLLAAGQSRAQSAMTMENRFNNEIPGKEDTLAFRFKGTQLLASVIEYAKICADTGTYSLAVCNQAYQSMRKKFSADSEFYFLEKGKEVKTDYGSFLKRLTKSKLCTPHAVKTLDVLATSGNISRVEVACSGFKLSAGVALVKIKKQFGSEEEEVWEAVLASPILEEK